MAQRETGGEHRLVPLPRRSTEPRPRWVFWLVRHRDGPTVAGQRRTPTGLAHTWCAVCTTSVRPAAATCPKFESRAAGVQSRIGARVPATDAAPEIDGPGGMRHRRGCRRQLFDVDRDAPKGNLTDVLIGLDEGILGPRR